MDTTGPLNERTCPECGQTTLTRQWQEVNFCAGCGVEFGSTGDDRGSHVAVGLVLSRGEVDRLVDGEEVSRTRAVSNDRRVTVNLLKEPP
ncbi:hypothetical protein BRC94_08360 [Halobacteriales archaeon QS_5_70_17]|jgi:hypothetical protein|nr:MAG: hypothetical protein BRC94_08360 [Halobacteriales archaeon QS_5_70_17]